MHLAFFIVLLSNNVFISKVLGTIYCTIDMNNEQRKLPWIFYVKRALHWTLALQQFLTLFKSHFFVINVIHYVLTILNEI